MSAAGDARRRMRRRWTAAAVAAVAVLPVAVVLYSQWPALTGELRAKPVPRQQAQEIAGRRELFDLDDGDRVGSPDGTLYVEYRRDPVRGGDVFTVHRTGGGRVIGRFASETVVFSGWADDSSGFYVYVWVPPGLRSMTWLSGAFGPLSKVNIPGR